MSNNTVSQFRPAVDVVSLPHNLLDRHLMRRVVVVFDVLRATTSMITGLSAGAGQIIAFDSLDAVRAAAAAMRKATLGGDDRVITCGETNAVKPVDFDQGNSPGTYTETLCNGRTLLMSTTNGTRAIVAAAKAELMLVAALVNATSTARHLLTLGKDVTLLCSGTNGAVAPEDLLGAGAVVDAMITLSRGDIAAGPTAISASQKFKASRDNLLGVLRETDGGLNIRRVNLDADIEFASRLDRFETIGIVSRASPPVVTRFA